MTTHHIQLAIKASPDRVWDALVDGSITPAYYVGFEAKFDLTEGAPYAYTAGGGDMITGIVTGVEPGSTLATTFNGHWDPAIAELAESTVIFELGEPAMPLPGITVLSCRHDGLDDSPAAMSLESGWVTILSGLKTLLETGRPMVDAA